MACFLGYGSSMKCESKIDFDDFEISDLFPFLAVEFGFI